VTDSRRNFFRKIATDSRRNFGQNLRFQNEKKMKKVDPAKKSKKMSFAEELNSK